MLVDVTAIRLVLAVWEGEIPRKVSAGTIIIPPPTPSIDPSVPAPSPMTTSKINVGISSNNAAMRLYLRVD